MTKTYTQVMKQIQALSREAETLKRKEVEGVISRIKEAIQAYGLTSADLGLTGARVAKGKPGRKPGKAAGKAKRVSSEPKFRDEKGQVWVGRGPRPQWLRDALANGKQLSDFAV